MKLKVVFAVAIIYAMTAVACSFQNYAKPENILSGQGSIASEGNISETPPESSISLPNEISTERFNDFEEEELLSIAREFAVNFPAPFSSTEDLNFLRFTLMCIYYDDPTAMDESGIVWVSPEKLSEEIELRFGISDYRFPSPEQENVYPRYVASEEAIAFYPVGEGTRYAVELTNQEANGEYRFYTFEIYDDFITDEHPEKTLEQKLCYKFHIVRSSDDTPFLQAISASEVE